MAVEVSLFLFMYPEEEIDDREALPGELHKRADEMARDLHRAGDITDLLLKDGWEPCLMRYDIEFWHEEVGTAEAARSRLVALGLDPDDLNIHEHEDEEGELAAD